MKFKTALSIVYDLAVQNALDSVDFHRQDELQAEALRQDDALTIVADFIQNCDLSEFDADDHEHFPYVQNVLKPFNSDSDPDA